MENPKIESVKTCSLTYKDITNKDCYCTVTEWVNGEGYDVSIESESVSKIFQIHMDELSAINLCIGALNLQIGDIQ